MREFVERRTADGVPMRILDGDEAGRIAPILPDTVVAASYCPLDAQIDSRRYVRAFATAAQRHGARIVEGAAARTSSATARRITRVQTDVGPISAGQVVLAAGAWSPSSRGPARDRDPDPPDAAADRPDRADAAASRRRPVRAGGGQAVLDLPASSRRSGRSSSRRRSRIGSGWPCSNRSARRPTARTCSAARWTIPGFDWKPDLAGVSLVAEGMAAAHPGAQRRPVRPGVGRRAAVHLGQPADHRPAPGFDDLIVAAGHVFGNGAGPTTGRLVADLICGTEPVMDMTPFRADRPSLQPVDGRERLVAWRPPSTAGSRSSTRSGPPPTTRSSRRPSSRTPRDGTAVDVIHLEGVPANIDYYYPMHLMQMAIFDEVRRLEERGYDAVVVGCCYDPGVRVARELVDIPVVGPLEAAMNHASYFGHSFTVVTDHAKARPWLEDLVRIHGAGNCRGVRTIDWYVTDMIEDTTAVADDAAAACLQALKDDQAEVVILGCTIIGGCLEREIMTTGRHRELPILNPNLLALKAAETLADLHRMGKYTISRVGLYQRHEQHDPVEADEVRRRWHLVDRGAVEAGRDGRATADRRRHRRAGRRATTSGSRPGERFAIVVDDRTDVEIPAELAAPRWPSAATRSS